MNKKIAIIISTKNRIKFIINLCKYYSYFGDDVVMYIGDASDLKKHNELKKKIEKFKKNLSINLIHQKHCNRFELVGTSHF